MSMEAVSRNELPLTLQQAFFWRYYLENHVVTFSLRITGSLNAERLRRCGDELIRRHDSLRTRVLLIDGVPHQRVEEIGGEPQVQIREMIGVSFENTARDILRELIDRRSAMSNGCLFLLQIVTFSDRESLVIWSIDHAVVDGVSLKLMFTELWQLYVQGLTQSHLSLANETRYSDYAVWQQTEDCAWRRDDMVYWAQRLRGAKPIQWSTQGKPGVVGLITLPFDPDVAQGLHEFARRRQTLMSMVMLTIFSVVVCRWCNQRDFIVPFVIDTRDHPGHQTTIGFFSYPLFLRIQITGTETLFELLKTVTREFLRALMHPDLGRVAIQKPEMLSGDLFQWCPWDMGEELGVPTPTEARALGFSAKIFVPERDIVPEKPTVRQGVQAPFAGVSTAIYENRDGIRIELLSPTEIFAADDLERFAQNLLATAEMVARSTEDMVIEGLRAS